MLGEIWNLGRLLGLPRMLANVRAFKTARRPIRGYVQTQAMFTLIETGLLDELEEPDGADVEGFCRERDLDPVIVAAVCRYLERSGLLRTAGNRAVLSRKGQKLAARARGVFEIFVAYRPYFDCLTSLTRREVTLDELKRHDEWVARGFRETGARFTFPILAEIIRRLGFRSMIELGCGALDLTRFMAADWTELKALGIDRDPEPLAEAERACQNTNLAGRVKIQQSDVFDLEPSQQYDPYEVVAAIDFFHGYFWEGEERLLQMLGTLKRAFPGKDFVVSEMVVPDVARMRKVAYPYVEHELFHDLNRQRTFAEGQLEGLVEKAGFTIAGRWSMRNLAARVFLHFR